MGMTEETDLTTLSDDQLRTLEKQLTNDAAKFNSMQMAQKILLNSLYGALGTNSFRYFDLNLASSVTTSGQHAIKWIERKLNELIDEKVGIKKDRIVLIDTDSVVIDLEDFVNKYCPSETSREGKLKFIDKFGSVVLNPYIEASYQELAQYMNAYEPRLKMKRENIINTMVSVAAKSYVMEVYNSEGVQYSLDDPYMKIMGLQLVKSSTPQVMRDALRDALPIMLHGTERDMQQYVKNVRAKFDSFTVEQIAAPCGITSLSKYDKKVLKNILRSTTDADKRREITDAINIDSEYYVKKTPVHVKGSLIYNSLISKYGLSQQRRPIGDGDKVKYVYLKSPNPIREECIAFQDSLPEEFGLHKYVDYNRMFEKTFVSFLKKMIDPLKWSTEQQANLLDWFE